MFTAEDILKIAEGYSSPDDWGVNSIYPSVLRQVVERAEQVGATVEQIIEHGKNHYGRRVAILTGHGGTRFDKWADCRETNCPYTDVED